MKLSNIKNRFESIQISLINTFSFCEQLYYLVGVKGYRMKPTRAMLQGTQTHARHNAMGLVTKDSLVTIPDAILQAKKFGTVTRKGEFSVKGKILSGRIDELLIAPEEITIIDYKSSSRDYESNRNQVWGCCKAFKEKYHSDLPIYGVIKNSDTREEIWRAEFTKSAEKSIDRIVERMVGIRRYEIAPEPKGIPDICDSCSFNRRCEKRAY